MVGGICGLNVVFQGLGWLFVWFIHFYSYFPMELGW